MISQNALLSVVTKNLWPWIIWRFSFWPTKKINFSYRFITNTKRRKLSQELFHFMMTIFSKTVMKMTRITRAPKNLLKTSTQTEFFFHLNELKVKDLLRKSFFLAWKRVEFCSVCCKALEPVIFQTYLSLNLPGNKCLAPKPCSVFYCLFMCE